ncbi:adenosylcobinamide-phosphate synthase CbiB [Parendozoicomonas haliclonae]|uniref:Cobalamin biosynthesis protein CobD n=1 Tax=Parendozoicomonas haliclonae TaxID=1960125 RepID=A0A1X7ALF5_9GAMM|nr:adenosylcobinamide-phosphate synthase CbiB [Parendozoicomonas haliclonae]SMA48786.1 cobalamin biosynthesis protein [Parendozoicomonas haliclonae]
MSELLLSVGAQCFLAVVLDLCIGEVNRWHPLVGFGRLAKRVEAFFYPPTEELPENRFPPGVLATAAAILPLALAAWLLSLLPNLGWFIEVLILYFAIGGRSLAEHARYVSKPLAEGDLEEARTKTGWLVSRETKNLTPDQMIRATIESVLENGNDSVFGALFWFTVAGAPGVVIYRLANTLDAMWGYKNERYLYFGRAAARLDDALNWIPARLGAVTYGIQGNLNNALSCWWKQAGQYKSRNGGAVIAAGAGALGFTLGGKSVYDGVEVESPVLGCGQLPNMLDIERTVSLVSTGTWIWVATILLLQI